MSNTYTTIKLIHETYSVSEVSSFISTDSRFSDQKDHLSTCAKSSRPSPKHVCNWLCFTGFGESVLQYSGMKIVKKKMSI